MPAILRRLGPAPAVFAQLLAALLACDEPNISIQQASVQRKFVTLLPNLTAGPPDQASTYMSDTEKTGANDKNPRIWKATAGFLQVGPCAEGGLALRTVSDSVTRVGDSVLFQPLPGSNNTAAGDLLIGVGAKIQ